MAKKIITTSNNSGTVFTTSSGNVFSATSTNTAYYPNIGNQFVYDGASIVPSPFNITFSWDDKTVNVTLKNGNDIFKLANAFMEWLDTNEIEYNVKTKGRKKRK
jgi:hypothetical protein